MSLVNISEAALLLSEETTVETPRARGGRLRHFAGAAGAVLLLGAVAAVALFQVVTPSAAGLVVPASTANVKFLEKAVTMKDEVEEVEAPCDNATTPCPTTPCPDDEEEDTPCTTNTTTSTPCPDPDTDVDASGDVVDDVETPCSTNTTTSTPCPDTDIDGSGDVVDDVDGETPCATNTTTTPCPDTDIDTSGDVEDIDVPCTNATTAAPCAPVDGKCKDGFFLSCDYTCVATCPSGFYGDTVSGACTACIAGCATCSDSVFCSKCSTGLYLYTELAGDMVCVVACPEDTTADEVSGACKVKLAIR